MSTDAAHKAEPIEWAISDRPVDYLAAVAAMEARVAAIAAGTARELIWLLEHPPLYTAGTSARSEDLLQPDRFPVHATGQYTYHGPGQRIVYVLLDLKPRGRDVRAFITALEGVVIDTLGAFNIRGEVRPDRVGVWVRRPERGPDAEDKIAAIGLRLRHWVSFHGLSLNVEPDLEHFSGIVPCGVAQHGVTSFADLGFTTPMTDVDMALERVCRERLGTLLRVAAPVGG
jgi:lipoyl(octanoyl) transferase